MLVSSSCSSFGLSGNIQIIFFVLKAILLELSRYCSMRLNVWYCICFGRAFKSCFLVGYVPLVLIAFSTISMVCRLGSCIILVVFLSSRVAVVLINSLLVIQIYIICAGEARCKLSTSPSIYSYLTICSISGSMQKL